RRPGRGALRGRPHAYRRRGLPAASGRERAWRFEVGGTRERRRRHRSEIAMARESHHRRAVIRLGAAAALGLAGCAGGPAAAGRGVPAVIADPTPESRVELERAVGELLGGVPVTLAADALTSESLLILERREPRDAEGRPLSGRSFERPERIRLVLRG